MQKYFFARVATALALAALPLSLFSAPGETDSLPEGFIPVEYIESTGTQFINTLLKASNSMSLDMKIETTGATSDNRAFFGTVWSVNQYLLFSQGGYFKFAGGGAAICAIDANTPYTITAGGGKVTVLNEKTGVESSVSEKNFGGDSGWCIFAHNRAPDNEKGIFRLRSAKVWMEDKLVRDFHPCYTNTADGGEVIGLYDTANDVFYTNAGTGVFLRGDEVEDTILVTGSPVAVGTPVSTRLSGYGKYHFAPGETVKTTVTDETGTDGSTRWTLRGWTLIEKLADGTVVATTSSDESNKTTCSVTCQQGYFYELDWNWKVEHLVTVSADVGLTASASAQWVEHGDSVTLTASSTEKGEFMRWMGDVVPENRFSAMQNLVVTNAMTLVAKTDSVPAGFIPVEYIESTGTQFINTLLTAGNSMSLDMKIETTGTTSGERAFFGTIWSYNRYLLFSQGGYFKFAGDGAAICAIDANTPYTITAGGGKVTVLNEKTGEGSSVSGKNFGGGSGWCIFARNGGGDNEKGIFRLRSAKVWMADELVRDFHPCYTNTADGGEVIGLYDTANDVFYTNAGTGVFLRGAEVADAILVTGSPVAVGTPVSTQLSGYGKHLFEPGETVKTTVTDETGNDGSTRWTLRGWTLIEKLADGTVVATTSSDESNKTTCSVTCRQGCLYELDWKWKVEHLVKVSADEGLTASASAQWVEHGDSVTLTATSAGDKDFVRWTGDVTGVDAVSPTFTTTVTGPMTLAAKTPAAVYYVAPDGTGAGSSWTNAFGSIQDAVTAAGTAADGAIVYVKAGNYFQTAAVTATGVGPLTIRGGYTGEGLATGGTTVVARENGAAQCNLFSFSGSTVTLDSLVISNGYTASVYYGQGVALMNACTAFVVNCRFLNNGNGNVDADSDHFGGAIGAENGTLRVYDSTFEGNCVQGGSGNVRPCGGAIGMTGTTGSSAQIRRCSFTANFTQSASSRGYGGGALGFLGCPSVEIDHCTFLTNWCYSGSSSNYSTPLKDQGPYGGTIYFGNATAATIADCTFRGGWNASYNSDTPTWGWGGVLCVADKAKVALVRTKFFGTGACDSWYTAAPDFCSGSIDVKGSGSALYMTNVLHAGAVRGPCLGNNGGTIDAVNCTFAGAIGEGSQPSAAYVQYGSSGVTTFRNCIVWGNKGGYLYEDNGGTPTATYCDLQGTDPDAEKGIISADPRFRNPSVYDYSLRSRSPCGNAGDETGIPRTEKDIDGNPRYKGRIDMGCYESRGDPFCIRIY